MADRELLKAAARAAGINTDPLTGDARMLNGPDGKEVLYFHNGARSHPMCRQPNEPGNVPWDPLADDGDALRLAVRLRIDIRHWDGPLRISAEHPDIPENTCMQETLGGPMWATRRAIVRAAAAMAPKEKTNA